MEKEEILALRNLRINFNTERGIVPVIRGVSLTVHAGEILALVGESGSGKSVTAHAVLKLNPTPMAEVTGGGITLCGRDVLRVEEKDMRTVRGVLAGMVFQEHMTGLDPTMRIGKQLVEALPHGDMAQAVRLLESVRIPDAQRRILQYPHEFSGGMRQRVMIAMALAQNPRLLIADEPTTALDVTVQAQILSLLETIRAQRGTAILLITHDLGVVANLADRVAVMYAGRIVEEGAAADIFHRPAHPYTQALLGSIPLYFQTENQKLHTVSGAPPDLYALPTGCAFAKRCTYCMPRCEHEDPPDFQPHAGHRAACWRFTEAD